MEWVESEALRTHMECVAACMDSYCTGDAQERDAWIVAGLLHRAAQSTPSARAVAARGRAMAKHANGRAADALADYLEAARLHSEEGDELAVGRVHRSLVDVYQMSGDVDQAMRSAEAAREIFERLRAPRLLAQLETLRAIGYAE